MTFLVERLAELRRYLDHLSALQARAMTVEQLARLPGLPAALRWCR